MIIPSTATPESEAARADQASAFGLPIWTPWDGILEHIESVHAVPTTMPSWAIIPHEWRLEIVTRYGNVFSRHTVHFTELVETP